MSAINLGPALQRAGLPYGLGKLFAGAAPQSAGTKPPYPTVTNPLNATIYGIDPSGDPILPWDYAPYDATSPAPAPTLPMTREQFDSTPNPDVSPQAILSSPSLPPPVASPVQGPSTANMGQPRQSSPLFNTIASRMKGPITSTAGGISTERSALGKPF